MTDPYPDLAWHPMDPDAKSFLEEDCQELLDYLVENPLPGSTELLAYLEEGNPGVARENLEKLVFIASRLFAICAFDHEKSLEAYRLDLVALLKQSPPLLVAMHVYRREVELGEINEEMDYQTLLAQTNRLEQFLDEIIEQAHG